MALSTARKKSFRTLGHSLNPIVTVAGKGLTDNILTELDRALEDHELIKVKLVISDRELRKSVVQEIANNTRSEIVQEIGKVVLLFREAKKPNPKLSNILR